MSHGKMAAEFGHILPVQPWAEARISHNGGEGQRPAQEQGHAETKPGLHNGIKKND